jgi:VanZ family protein
MTPRERRLWWWIAAVLAAVYATVYPAQAVLLFLRSRGWLGTTIWTLFGLTALVVVVAVLRARPRAKEVALLLAMAAIYGLIIVRLDIIQERIHFVQYGAVAGLVHEALRERRPRAGAGWAAALGAAAFTAVAGWIDELLQALMPNRVYDPRDIGFNALAGALAAFTMSARLELRRGAGANRSAH